MRYAPTGDIEKEAFFPLSRLFLFGLTGYHLGGSLERGVPFGSELTDKGVAQETVGWNAQPFTQNFCGTAYLPPMKVDGTKATVLRDANRVQSARDRLHKRRATLSEGLFQSTMAGAIRCITRKNTIPTVDNRRHLVAIGIQVRDTLLADHFSGILLQLIPHRGQGLAKLLRFTLLQRRARLTLNATSPATLAQVAHKPSLDHIETHNRIFYLNHMGKVDQKTEIRKRKGKDMRGEILHVFGIFLLPVG